MPSEVRETRRDEEIREGMGRRWKEGGRHAGVVRGMEGRQTVGGKEGKEAKK